MKTHTHPRILRTYELITKGVAPKKADAVVIAAANTLHALAKAPRIGSCTCGPCTRGEPCRQIQSHKPQVRAQIYGDFPSAPVRADLLPAPGTYPAAPARGKLDLGKVASTLNQEAA